MRVLDFVREADRALQKHQPMNVKAVDVSVVISKCREKKTYDSPVSYIASWLLLENVCAELVTVPHSQLISEILTSLAIIEGNPATEAMGEMYWADGYCDSEDEWIRPNSAFGMSDKECFLFGFAHNAKLVLPVIDKSAELGLRSECFKRLKRARNMINRVLKSGNVTSQDNMVVHDNLAHCYGQLNGLFAAIGGVHSVTALNAKIIDERFAHLLKWDSPCFVSVKGKHFQNPALENAVRALAALDDFVHHARYEYAGPLFLALRDWDPSVLGMWMATLLTEVFRELETRYSKFVASLPKIIERGSKVGQKSHKFESMNRSQRDNMQRWYRSGEGRDVRAAANELVKVYRAYAKLKSKSTTIGAESETVRPLDFDDFKNAPPEIKNRFDDALLSLGKGREGFFPKIIKIARPRLAAYAIWLSESDFIDAQWDADEINTYIRYTYR